MTTTRDSNSEDARAEEERRDSGDSDAPVEDALVTEFENTLEEGRNRLNRTWRALVITGLYGGIDVGVGILAMLAVLDATDSTLLGGLAFGLGLLALRLAHSELFTEDFLVPIYAICAGHGSWRQLLKLLVITLVTNLAGGWVFMWLIVVSFPDLHPTLIDVAERYFEPGLTWEGIGLAILAGSTITLATRMAQSASAEFTIALISFMSGLLVVGVGMLHGALNSVVIFGAIQAGADITYGQWLGWAWWVIIANMVGGLFIITLPRMVRTWELITAERTEQKRKRAA